MNDIAVDVAAVRGSFRLDAKTEFSRSGASVVLGPSGAGKTTPPRAISVVEPDAGGRVRIGSQPWPTANPAIPPTPRSRRRLCVPGWRACFGISLCAAIWILPSAGRERREPGSTEAKSWLCSPIEKLLDQAAATFSGGEDPEGRHRARPKSRPQLLMMDEPLSALDIARRAEALAYLERVPEEFGIPIIYVTHAIRRGPRARQGGSPSWPMERSSPVGRRRRGGAARS